MARLDELVDGIYRICTTVQLPDTGDVVDRLEALDASWVHGARGSVERETIAHFMRALREGSFGYQASCSAERCWPRDREGD